MHVQRGHLVLQLPKRVSHALARTPRCQPAHELFTKRFRVQGMSGVAKRIQCCCAGQLASSCCPAAVQLRPAVRLMPAGSLCAGGWHLWLSQKWMPWPAGHRSCCFGFAHLLYSYQPMLISSHSGVSAGSCHGPRCSAALYRHMTKICASRRGNVVRPSCQDSRAV